MRRALGVAAAFCVIMAVGRSTGVAQEPARHPLEPSDTSSPRATLKSFIEACNELYDLADTHEETTDFAEDFLPTLERIRDCVDLSGLPADLRESVAVESAVYLKEVLDRIALPEDDEIPDATAADLDQVNRWRIPGTRITIVRAAEGPSAGAYLFSSETVRSADKFYSAVKDVPYRTGGPRVTPKFHDRYEALTREQPTLSADTASPRGTLTLFLDTCNKIYEAGVSGEFVDRLDPRFWPDVLRIYSCLDLSEIPEYSRDFYAAEAAVCLKEVLDRATLPPAEEIPGPEDLKSAEGGEPLARWQIPNTEITITRLTEGSRRGEYVFSADTVKRAPEMYAKVKSMPYRKKGRAVSKGLYDWWLMRPGTPMVAAWVDRLPDGFHRRAFGMAVWQWFGLLLTTFAAIGLMIVVYRFGHLRGEAMREVSLLRYWATVLFAVVAMLVPLGFRYVAFVYLSMRGTAFYIADFCAEFVFLLALIVVILATSKRLASSMIAIRAVRAEGLDANLIRILFRVLGLVVAAIVFLEGGRYLGIPITTLLASAGIGGLAIALAAQGMIRGLFGTVTVLLDRPYQVGERIVAKGQDGIVEEIGLRSTKIRAFLTNHVISIPNDQMADAEIENIGKREHIHRTCDLHIPLDTKREKIEKALDVIRTALENHEGMDPEFPPRVYFNEFNADSFNIRIAYWYTPPDLWSYYAFTEKINLEIFRAFEENGIQFSLPVRHSYWKRDDVQGPLDVNILDKRARSDSDASERAPSVAE